MDDQDIKLLQLKNKLAEEFVKSEEGTLDILIRQRNLIAEYTKEYRKLLDASKELNKNTDALGEYSRLNAIITQGYEEQLKRIASTYGIILDKSQKIAISDREMLKDITKRARELKDIKLAEDAQKTLNTLRALDITASAKKVFVGATSLTEGVTTTQAAGAFGRVPSKLMDVATKAFLVGGVNPATIGIFAGLATLSVAAIALKANLEQLKNRVASATMGMSALANLPDVKKEAMDYHATLGKAATAQMIEVGAVEKVARLMSNTVPGSIAKFLQSTNDTTMSLTTVVQYSRLLGLSEERGAKVLSDLYKMSARSSVGEERKIKATEELNMMSAYARKVLKDNVMTSTDFTTQLEGAIQATSSFQTSTGSLGALMNTLARIQSKSAPALSNIGEVAANITNQMRSLPDSLRVLLGGGLKGIWGWSEMEPTEQLKRLKGSALGQFFQLGFGASPEQKAISLMVARSLGLSEQISRPMIELGSLQEATQQEIKETREEARETQKMYKDVQGNVALIVQKMDVLTRVVSNAMARIVNLPVAK